MSGKFDDWFFSSGNYLKEEEGWLPTGYEGYWVHKKGFVIGKKGNVLKPHKGDDHGHLNVRIQTKNGVKEEYIHRLVAKAFIPNPNDYPYVRHLDDDPDNNDADNLDWGTQRDNYMDSVRNRTNRPFTDEDREKSYSMSRTPIIGTNLLTGEERYFTGQNDAARELGLQQSNIYKTLVGQRKHTMNWQFRYARGDEYE